VLVGERRRIVFSPLTQLFLVRCQKLAPLLLLAGRRVLADRRHRQAGIVKVVEQLDLGRYRKRSGFTLSAAASAPA
jgi:hypothetical protein